MFVHVVVSYVAFVVINLIFAVLFVCLFVFLLSLIAIVPDN